MTPRRTALATVIATALLLAACTSQTNGHVGNVSPVARGEGTTSSAPSSSPSGPAPEAVLHAPRSASNVSVNTPVTVSVDNGTLTSVQLVNPEGKHVTGSFNADKTSWSTTEDLGYSRTYQLAAEAVNADGKSVKKSSTLTTLTPSNMTMPYLNTVAGQSLINGATYGVGIVPVVHFDEPITDRTAAVKALSVTTSHNDTGVWYWLDQQNVHWRPRNYLLPNTTVTVSAKVYGVQVSPGLYGQADQSITFKIGAKRLAIADDKTHTVKVYFNNVLVRTMPTSMGRGGYVTGGHGQQIPLWTMPGTYTVITHENPAIMSSDSYGLPANSPAGYAPEKIYWSTKISTDGIYLHELDATVWAQGRLDLSHGCLNLNHDNAQWYFQHSFVGDVVQVVNTGGPAKVALWQGGDWTVPYAQLVSDPSLH